MSQSGLEVWLEVIVLGGLLLGAIACFRRR